MTGEAEDIGDPEHLTPQHDLAASNSGVAALDDWLRRHALANEQTGGSRTYVVCAGGRVVGYYGLATGAVAQASATGRVRRNMPDPVPVMILGRLAVDRAYQARGLGIGLLRDAILRTLQAADLAGIRAILVHAISDDAKRFTRRLFGTLPALAGGQRRWTREEPQTARPKRRYTRHVSHGCEGGQSQTDAVGLGCTLLREVRRVAERPMLAEIRHRLGERTPVVTRVPPSRAVSRYRSIYHLKLIRAPTNVPAWMSSRFSFRSE